MAFRKRNVAPGTSRAPPIADVPAAKQSPGVRPSLQTSHPTTSTGAQSLDGILGGHAGLPLGNTLLIEETGTTDYAGVLLKLFAAEGVVQGHNVHVVGVGEEWGRGLPAVVGAADGSDGRDRKSKGDEKDKMKIAWRYERLGEFGSERGAGVRAAPQPSRPMPNDEAANVTPAAEPQPFSHTFDLAKRIALPSKSSIDYIPIPPSGSPQSSLFTSIVQSLRHQLTSSDSGSIHRLIVPTILSPALYPPSSSHPSQVLSFLHALRALHRQFPTKLVTMLTLPLSLYPRQTGLVRWIERLVDGVIELQPFQHVPYEPPAGGKDEERPQGLLNVHTLPVFSERGGGATCGLGEDLAFTISRRRFVIKPYNLPPVDGEEGEGDKEGKGKELEF